MKGIFLLLFLSAPALAGNPPVNRAEEYVAVKKDDQMFRENVGASATQANSFVMGANVLVDCVSTVVNGRTDAGCAGDSANPECAGLNKIVSNAVTATDCKTKDKNGKCIPVDGYAGEEWFTFAGQYAKTMAACKDGKDATTKPEFGSLSEMATGKASQAGIILLPTGASGVTAGTGGSRLAEDLAAQFEDGAIHLGYENGEIMKKTFSGHSFTSIVLESPYGERLAFGTRAQIEEAMANPEPTLEKFRLAKEEKLEKEDAAEDRTAEKNFFARAIETEKRSRGLASTKAPFALQANENSRYENKTPQLPESAFSATTASSESFEEASLFKRVSLSYRKHEGQLKALGDSRTGDAIRAMGTPEVFRGL